MRALVFRGVDQPLALETLPDPVPGPGEVVIKVARCGICGTDLHRSRENLWTAAPGTVMGHEFSGEIVALGHGVEGLSTGMAVTALPYIGCGKCGYCTTGNPHFCPTRLYVGTEDSPGGYAEYVKVGADCVTPLAGGLSLDDGALVEPLAVGLHGVHRARINPADRVLVIGAGPIGLAATWWARRFGARHIVVTAPSTRRRDMALSMGADSFITAADDAELAQRAAEELGGKPDVVLECVGGTGLINRAMTCVATHGRVVVLGLCTHHDHIVPLLGMTSECDIRFSVVYNVDEFRQCIEALDAGDIAPRAMITDSVPLTEGADAFAALQARSSQCKVMLRP